MIVQCDQGVLFIMWLCKYFRNLKDLDLDRNCQSPLDITNHSGGV